MSFASSIWEVETHEPGPGDFFSIGPGHDSWVIGDEPHVSLHFMGAEE